ncbi:MAG: SDR family oxidoreductase [Robiginitomaculum sp.]
MKGYSLQHKVALITGAASGIGKEIAKLFAELGADLVLSDMNFEGLKKVKKQLGCDVNCKIVKCDLGRYEQCRELVQEAAIWKGHLDILVNAAALYKKILNEEVDKAYFDRVTDVNMAGPFFLLQACSEQMKKQASGKIILFTSIAAHRGGVNGSTVYAMTKAAVISLMKSLAKDLAPYGVCVNSIAPGGVDTPMLRGQMTEEDMKSFIADIPLGRLATAKEIAGVCAFVASDSASYITGHTFDVNGGQLMR